MDLGTLKFIESRIEEIKEMDQRINAARPMLTFQRLPRHMKRRIMGHTSKRIPRSIIDQHLKQQAKSGLPKKSKPPSRKHRRRPKNARLEFERRECKRRWLETHLWHAKRFHLVEKWGFKIAHHPNDRSWRACWRAITGHCLLFDLSYLTCIELYGKEANLLGFFKSMTYEHCKDDVFDSAVISGAKEGQVVLYKRGAFPDGCLGCVRVMWRPNCEAERRVWLWCHPGAQEEILKHISEVVMDAEVKFNALDGQLNRYRLVGPLSQPVLRDALTIFEKDVGPDWLDTNLLKSQQEVWKSLQNGRQASPGHIIGLTIDSRPKRLIGKRNKSLNQTEAMETDQGDINEIVDSQLWDSEILQQVVGSDGNCAPVLLVHRPPIDGLYGQGWDIITPKKHGLPLWLRMIMCGARVGALRELQLLNWNTLNSEDLCFYPDSALGQSEDADTCQKAFTKFNSLPPGKRVGTPWFNVPWQTLLEEWSADGQDKYFFVQRDKSQLDMARSFVERPSGTVSITPKGLIAILLTLEGGGTLERGAAVCLAKNQADLMKPVEEDKIHLSLQRHLQTEGNFDIANLFSRRVAGFVAEGEYSFHRGCHAGIAFVTAASVNMLIQSHSWNQNLQVLVKSKSCPLYRKGSVKVI